MRALEDRQSVYVAGYEAVTAWGAGVDATLSNMLMGVSPAGAVKGVKPKGYPQALVGVEAPLPNALTARNAECSALEERVLWCCQRTLQQAGLQQENEEIGFVFASAKGNNAALTPVGSLTDYGRVGLYESASRIARLLGIAKSPVVISQACISGLTALIFALRQLQNGAWKHALVCAGDSVTPFIAEGFAALKALSTGECRPFDRQRDGLMLGGAAGAMLLSIEKPRKEVGFVLAGGATSNDAHHIVAPDPTGKSLARAVKEALAQADISPERVSLVSPHGTGTLYNDDMESQALHSLALAATPTLALKGYLGHTLGASGLVESIVSLAAMRGGVLPASRGYANAGTRYPLNMATENVPFSGDVLLKTGSGFGGCNAAVVFAKGERAGSREACRRFTEPKRLATIRIEQSKMWRNGELIHDEGGEEFAPFIRRVVKRHGVPFIHFGRLDRQCQLGIAAIDALLHDVTGLEAESTAVVLCNHNGCVESDKAYLSLVNAGNGDSPSQFIFTLPSIALGEMCLRKKIGGENCFFIERRAEGELPRELLNFATGNASTKHAIVGRCEYTEEQYIANLELWQLD